MAQQDESEQTSQPQIDVFSLVVCLLGNLLLRGAAAAGGTLISLYLASLQRSGHLVSAQVVGLSSMLFYSAELLGSPGFGMLSDLKGRKPFMLFGPIFGGAALQFIALAPTIPLILAARLLQGLSTASSVPSTLSYLSLETSGSEELRGRVMSFFEVATIVGMAGGFATGGILWDRFRHSGFFAVVVIYVASGLLLWAVRDRHAIARRAREATMRLAVFKSPSALRLIPAWVAVNAIVGLWLSHVDFQMAKAHDSTQLLVGGYTGLQIGLYTGAVALLFVGGIALWSLTFGRLRTTQIMSIALVGLAFLVLMLFLLNHSHRGDVVRIAVLLVLAALSLLVMSGFTPAALSYLAGMAEEFPETRGSMMGLYSVFLGVGQFIGAGLGGTFADWRGVDGMIVLSAILGCISAACLAALIRRDKTHGRVAAAGPVRLPPGLH